MTTNFSAARAPFLADTRQSGMSEWGLGTSFLKEGIAITEPVKVGTRVSVKEKVAANRQVSNCRE